MSLYDRYLEKETLEKDLPNPIDFGRFAILDKAKGYKELTYSNFQTDKLIQQKLLKEENKSLQDIFIDISIDIDKSANNSFEVIPLIRRIKNKLGLNGFENLLKDKIFHLEEIFRQPHYLLERTIEKVHVSRAKRIPSKSYQYLASHTEDWIHKSIVSFKPSRILNEELETNFDIYENQLTISFIERSLTYLNSRLKEIQDIKSFLNDYEKLLKNRDDQKGWYKKIERNLSLIGAVYDDEHYHSNNPEGSKLTETEEILNQINKRLTLLRKSELFDLVNKRTSQTISLRNTNVLVDHKHYRYIKSLWIELDKVKPEKNENEKVQFEQDVFKGVVSYANALIVYSLKELLEYEIKGNYAKYLSEHIQFPGVSFLVSDKGIFEITVGKQKIKCIVLANKPELNEITKEVLKKQNAYLFYYVDVDDSKSERLININPLDPDSAERVGEFLKKVILKEYLNDINYCYEYKHLLKEYIQFIPSQYIDFNFSKYTYKFNSYPKSMLAIDEIKKAIENNQVFKSKSRPDQDNIIITMCNLVSEINFNADRLKNDFLFCFNCGDKLKANTIDKLNYIKCHNCNCVVDSTINNKLVVRIDDARFQSLSPNEFGMDYIEFNPQNLWE